MVLPSALLTLCRVDPVKTGMTLIQRSSQSADDTSVRASLPSMGRILLDERSQPGPMTVTVANRKAKPRGEAEKAGSKLSTVGTRTGSEAGCGRQTGWQQRSPKVIKTHQVEPGGTRGQILFLAAKLTRLRRVTLGRSR